MAGVGDRQHEVGQAGIRRLARYRDRKGKGQLKMLSSKAFGILDHMWKDPQASWIVPARLVPNGEGCTLLMTFFQPPALDDQAFATASKEIDRELNRLKEILER